MNHTCMRWISGGFFLEKQLDPGDFVLLTSPTPGENSQLCSTNFTIPQIGPGSYPWGKPMTCALDVRRKLFGEEHGKTADSYHSLGVTQHELGNYTSALLSHQHALDVTRKLFGEEHADIANSYHDIGVTQYELGDYTSALQSHLHALDVRRKLFGEEHASNSS